MAAKNQNVRNTSDKNEYGFHPIANVFPMMSDLSFDALAYDIKQNGLNEDVWLDYDGKLVVDGRNRYLACVREGVDIRYQRLGKDENILTFIISRNIHRRHLNHTQKAFAAAKVANAPRGRHRKEKSGSKCVQISQNQASEMFSVNVDYVKKASRMLKDDNKEVMELTSMVEDGVVSLSKAYQSAYGVENADLYDVSDVVGETKKIAGKQKPKEKFKKESESKKIAGKQPARKKNKRSESCNGVAGGKKAHSDSAKKKQTGKVVEAKCVRGNASYELSSIEKKEGKSNCDKIVKHLARAVELQENEKVDQEYLYSKSHNILTFFMINLPTECVADLWTEFLVYMYINNDIEPDTIIDKVLDKVGTNIGVIRKRMEKQESKKIP